MQPTYSADAERYRKEVQAFLSDRLPASWRGVGQLDGEELTGFVTSWRTTLYKAGYLAPGWPVEYGGSGLSPLEQVVLAEEFVKAGVPTGGPNDAFGIQMLGNTLLLCGTDEQKRHYLPRILSGEDTWCQGYSEPNAGSDLANVGLKAERDGDQWVLNGQKIWTSAGHLADHIFTLARTDPDPGPDAAISKLYWSEYHKIVTELAVHVIGAEAMTPSGRLPSSAFSPDDAGASNTTDSWVGASLNARAGTIYAGSSQVQRNIIGEMVLGLAKEPIAR